MRSHTNTPRGHLRKMPTIRKTQQRMVEVNSQQSSLEIEGALSHGIHRIVLDVLKPHTPRLTDLAMMLSREEGVTGVNMTLEEVDQNTESISITLGGEDLRFEVLREILEDAGAVIHSIDQVVAGEQLIEQVPLSPEDD